MPFWVFAVSLMTIFLVVVCFVSLNIFRNSDTVGHSQSKLVTIYDQGVKKTILTESNTVAEAIKEAGMATDESDTVEPALDTFMVASSYSINIYRARPVVVRDGDHELRVVTAEQTGKTIAQAAGVDLANEDIVTIEKNEDILIGGGAIIVADINRAVPVELILYGQSNRLLTRAETVAEFLQEKNIKTEADVFISPSVNTKITPNIQIKVWREGVNTVTIEEDIPFGTRESQSNDHLQGYSKVESDGKNGRRSVTYEVLMVNGKEESRREIQSVVIIEPIEEVKVVGIKLAYSGSNEDWLRAAGIPSSEWSYVDFIIQRESGWRPHAINASSGATGLCQALPGSKMASAGADWATNPITQLKWCHGYAASRYGSWAAAYNFWINNHWW